MAVRPLRPATDRSLGELLPHLLANRSRAPLPAPFGFPLNIATKSSCGISSSFPELSPSRRQVTHVLLTRPPLYSPPCGDFRVRLACVRHAASVDSEPGSNSHIESIQKPVFFALSGCQRTVHRQTRRRSRPPAKDKDTGILGRFQVALLKTFRNPARAPVRSSCRRRRTSLPSRRPLRRRSNRPFSSPLLGRGILSYKRFRRVSPLYEKARTTSASV